MSLLRHALAETINRSRPGLADAGQKKLRERVIVALGSLGEQTDSVESVGFTTVAGACGVLRL